MELTAIENRKEEAKPYDVVMDAFTSWHNSYVESAQKMLEYVTSSEEILRKIITFLSTFTSTRVTRTQRDVEEEIIAAVDTVL